MRVLALLLSSLLPLVPAGATQPAAPAAAATAPCERIFGAVWRIDYDAAGQVAEITLDGVIDPTNGATPEEAARRPIQMELPPVYVAAVRAFLSRRPHPPGDGGADFSYTIYDPAQPERADITSREDCLRGGA